MSRLTRLTLSVCFIVATLQLLPFVDAQQAQPAASNMVVPRLIRFGGSVRNGTGKPPSGVVGVTFALYKNQDGGAALWLETQNVSVDGSGRYTVLLGATKEAGVPMELFTSGEAQWLGVRVEGEGEQPRILLVSVPYALKAADADTVGGLPPSAFALAPTSNVATNSSPASPAATAPIATATGTTAVTTAGGVINKVAKFDAAADVTSSEIFDNGTNVGIGNTAPASKLDVSGGAIFRGLLQLPAKGTASGANTAGFASQPVDLAASVWNSGTLAAVAQHFRWQAEPANNYTASPSGTLNLLYASGTGVPAETGFKISSKGLITFAMGQTLPTVTGNETVTGNLSAKQLISTLTTGTPPLTVSSTTQVPNLNASLLGGLGAGAFAQLAVGNIFTQPQTVNAGAVMRGLQASSTLSGGAGVYGADNNPNSVGVLGFSSSASGTGVWGFGDPGIAGLDNGLASPPTAGSGVAGTSYNGSGVKGISGGASTVGSQLQTSAGVWADSNQYFGTALYATIDTGHAGVFFNNSSDSTVVIRNWSEPASGPASVMVALSGNNFCQIDNSGNLLCTGSLSGSAKNFRIDHPLDPGNKYLTHASMESSEMLNVYSGNVTTDAGGRAVIALPGWFETVNGDFRYQLTVIGQFAQAAVEREIADHQFTVKTDKPNVKVSWQVTGVRRDAWAKAHPLEVETEKMGAERGRYLHPELYGANEEKSIGSLHHAKSNQNNRSAKPAATHKVYIPGVGER